MEFPCREIYENMKNNEVKLKRLYWLMINHKFIKPKSFKYEYASRYSRLIWKKLMDRFKHDSDFKIGANDVSDYVYNAILDALDGYSYPKETETINNINVKNNNYLPK